MMIIQFNYSYIYDDDDDDDDKNIIGFLADRKQLEIHAILLRKPERKSHLRDLEINGKINDCRVNSVHLAQCTVQWSALFKRIINL
jgi:hypothetical protein